MDHLLINSFLTSLDRVYLTVGTIMMKKHGDGIGSGHNCRRGSMCTIHVSVGRSQPIDHAGAPAGFQEGGYEVV